MRLGLSGLRRRRGMRIIAFFATAAVAFLMCLAIYHLRPAFITYSKTYANNIANTVVNEAVNEVFSKSDYDSLTKTHENSPNSVKAIEADAAKINKLKSDINNSVQKNIEKRSTDTIYVPLGSALDFYFLAGLGPKIPVRIYPVSIVHTDFNEGFESVGINQVKHKLYLDVSIQMALAGVGFAQTETVKTSTLLIETIIVGDTPEYYGNGNISAAVK